MRSLALKLEPKGPFLHKRFEVIWFRSEVDFKQAQTLFTEALRLDVLDTGMREMEISHFWLKHQKTGVIHPKCTSLAAILNSSAELFEVDEILLIAESAKEHPFVKSLEWSWKEPAIEALKNLNFESYVEWRESEKPLDEYRDNSWDACDPDSLGLPFTEQEKNVLLDEQKKQGRPFTRAEWELFAQTWSEHCKHKIFNAVIKLKDGSQLRSLFKTYIKNPSEQISKSRTDCQSMFYDNAGVVAIRNYEGHQTDWSLCSKMETHNSPSAISPFGGAATGVVGVHRDILGTGLGAKPIANWNLLCFESEDHDSQRPEKALPPSVIRSGVLRGIEVGGNHSGIPTVQGSVHFHPSYAVKPYVFAGALGLIPKKYVHKKPKSGQTLYCVGGATGIDGVRGAVMSSRSIEEKDFEGSSVQVANPFVQRCLTDFLLRARDMELVDSITDNGAGGLASSVGEMALSTGGAKIDLSNMRLKASHVPAWIKLLSESQERMTVATRHPKEFEALANQMGIGFDHLGELSSTGFFEVTCDQKMLVSVSLEVLHDACPVLNLETQHDKVSYNQEILNTKLSKPTISYSLGYHQNILNLIFGSDEMCSREGIVRRFDHEVQGRSLRKPYSGPIQKSPSQGSVIEIPEVQEGASVVLVHGAYPEAIDVPRATEKSLIQTHLKSVLMGAQLDSLVALDNFSWPDPSSHSKSLFELVESCKMIKEFSTFLGVPFVSGKDSMKNNSDTFRANPALVVSIVGSSIRPELIPSSYVQRPNDIVAVLPPLLPTLNDSLFERCFGISNPNDNSFAPMFFDNNSTKDEYFFRVQRLSELISKGYLRSARAIGRGGWLSAMVKTSFGTGLGFSLHHPVGDPVEVFAEGYGGVVLTIDPHFAEDVFGALPQLIRMGVVVAEPFLEWAANSKINLTQVESCYQQKSQKGFWQ